MLIIRIHTFINISHSSGCKLLKYQTSCIVTGRLATFLLKTNLSDQETFLDAEYNCKHFHECD